MVKSKHIIGKNWVEGTLARKSQTSPKIEMTESSGSAETNGRHSSFVEGTVSSCEQRLGCFGI